MGNSILGCGRGLLELLGVVGPNNGNRSCIHKQYVV